MNIEDIKTAIDDFGRNNMCSDTVIEIKKGEIELKNVQSFDPSQICLMDCVFDFSRNFNDTAIGAILPELNSLIETSKQFDLIELHNS